MRRFTYLACCIFFLGLSHVHAQELEPRFPGCAEADDYDCADMRMMQFIFSNLKYPEDAKSAGIKGTVVVKFLVKADGSVTDGEILEGLGHGCDEEVIRLVGLMPKWLPATEDNGTAIDMEWEIDVTFK